MFRHGITFLKNGYKKYWIVNPITKTVQIYSFDGEEDSSQFSFDDEISVHIFDGLHPLSSSLLLSQITDISGST